MTLKALFQKCGVPSALVDPIVEILQLNGITDVQGLSFLEENRLHHYFSSPFHIDIMIKVLKQLDVVKPETIKPVDNFKFAIDKDLLSSEYFSDLNDVLKKRSVFSCDGLLVQYCSLIMLRDNPKRKFSSADNRKVCKELIKEFGKIIPTKTSLRRFTKCLGKRNSNTRAKKRDSLDCLLQDVQGKRRKRVAKKNITRDTSDVETTDEELDELMKEPEVSVEEGLDILDRGYYYFLNLNSLLIKFMLN